MLYLRRADLTCGILLTLLLTCIVGCGDGLPKRVPVSGRVLIDGKPLERGTILFVPKGERAGGGTLGPGGKFTLTTFTDNDGCVLGKHQIAVTACEPIGTSTINWFSPKKYTDISTSGIEVDITGPRDDVEINLTWNGGKPFTERN